jgi:hypothetical protein
MPKLPADGQTVTADYLRNITDDDAKEQLRHPKLWSYILRDPTGMIFSHGDCRTRKACESRAVEHAEGHAGEMLIISTRVPLDGWHFLAWPPSENCDKPVKPRAWRLSKAQMDVLTLCMWYKLSRDWDGWVSDDRTVGADPGRMYKTSTISSLWERGLLDANFKDPRVACGELNGERKFDGALRFQVWTSALGRKALEDVGLFVKGTELLYH